MQQPNNFDNLTIFRNIYVSKKKKNPSFRNYMIDFINGVTLDQNKICLGTINKLSLQILFTK